MMHNNNNTNNKIKILLFGPILDGPNAERAFLKSVTTLHKGKAGPFDVVFVVGTSHITVTAPPPPPSPPDDHSSSNSSLADNNSEAAVPPAATATTTTTTPPPSSSTTSSSSFLQEASAIGVPIYFHRLIYTVSTTDIQQQQQQPQLETATIATTLPSVLPVPETTASTGTTATTTGPTTNNSSPVRSMADNIFVLEESSSAGSVSSEEAEAGGGKTTGIWSIRVTAHHPELIVVATSPHVHVNDKDHVHTKNNNNNNSGQKQHTSNSSSSKSATNDDDDVQALVQTLQNPSYRGCDLLFTHEWPQGIESCLQTTTSSSASAAVVVDQWVSYDVAAIALLARARYHVSPGPYYQQSIPFEHLPAITNTGIHQTQVLHVGRFISLHPTTTTTNTASTTTLTPQQRKFNHAVGVVPLQYMSVSELMSQRPHPVQPCPYTDTSYFQMTTKTTPTLATTAARRTMTTTTTTTSANGIMTGGLSEASARRILAEERQRDRPAPAQRWSINNNNNNNNNNKRRPMPEHYHPDENNESVDPNNTALFLHGLHQDVTGQLQLPTMGDDLIRQALANAGFLGLQHVRRPLAKGSSSAGGAAASSSTSSSFCFLQFETHEQARTCLEQTGGTITIHGVHLTLKWATAGASSSSSTGNPRRAGITTGGDVGGGGVGSKPKRIRLTEAEAQESTTVYYKLPASMSNYQEAGERLRKFMETTLEVALSSSAANGGTGDDDAGPPRVTAAEEPALQVQLRLPNHHEGGRGGYGFLDFASHAAASMALATLTGSTDGGRLVPDALRQAGSDNSTFDFDGLYLHWGTQPTNMGSVDGSNKPNHNNPEKDMIEDDVSGFKFERKHFPPDSRTDCWFCLASDSCEKHLITGVYDQCYMAMPKGAAHPGHVLIIPVQHASVGLLRDRRLAEEAEQIKRRLREHAAAVYDPNMGLYVFERAIQTKHGYHTHVHCIPVEQQLGVKLQSTMHAQARKIGFDLREVNSDLGLDVILSSSSSSSNQKDHNDCKERENGVGRGYFYAEIPTGSGGYRRMLYQCGSNSSSIDNGSAGGGTTGGRGEHRLGNSVIVPLQFGLEVLAAVLGNPNIAHWKSCLVDREQETTMAAVFRESFATFEK